MKTISDMILIFDKIMRILNSLSEAELIEILKVLKSKYSHLKIPE